MNAASTHKAEARTIWLLSAYHTGSHAAWAGGYARHSRHNVQLLTLDGRFWKWRMQGGARALAAEAVARLDAPGAQPHDVLPAAILATDMVNLPAWLGLMRRRLPAATPVLLYMHENQLTYPWPAGERRDLTYAMINWQSMLAADAVAFNSAFHLESWFAEAPRLLKHFPDYNHLADVAAVRRRAFVLPAAIDTPSPASSRAIGAPDATSTPPLILWNQRWEYDKRPDRFFALLDRLDAAGTPFRLAVAGENFRNVPQEFLEAHARYGDRIEQWGHLPSRADYLALLQQANLVISTADHEFFGLSMLEAIAAGAFPLLPTRLSYPELIPAPLHAACLYTDADDLFAKARARLLAPRAAPPSLRAHVAKCFTWPAVAPRYDGALETLRAVA
jgi:glycosyltransferase involved in cell wall biosynthesis